MIKNRSIFILILIAGFGCTKKESPIHHEIKYAELAGEVVISGNMLADPFVIEVFDSVLIIGNLKGEPILELYSLKTGNLLKKTLSNGQGPLDVLAIGEIQRDDNKGIFYIYDLIGRKFLRYDLKKLLSETNYFPDLFWNLKDMNVPVSKIYFNENYLIAESSSPESRIVLLNEDLSIRKLELPFPNKVDPGLSDMANKDLHNSSVSVSPDGHYLGLVTNMTGLVDLVRITENGLDSVWSSSREFKNTYTLMPYTNQGEEKVQLFFTSSSQLKFMDASASNRFFYAAYSGKSRAENGESYQFADTIKAYSWDGSLETRYHVTPPIRRLAVTPDDKKLYGIAINDQGEYEVRVFNLH